MRRENQPVTQDDHFENLADTADALAETISRSAEVHDEMVGQVPGAAEHAERDRRLAEAERASAEALRRHELPPEDVQRVIRETRPPAV